MKRAEKETMNNQFKKVWDKIHYVAHGDVYRLNYCSAWYFRATDMYSYDEYIVLQSYNTVVAIYNVTDNVLYDGLRYVYGYTATSAQHISKFYNYIRENFRPDVRLYRFYA